MSQQDEGSPTDDRQPPKPRLDSAPAPCTQPGGECPAAPDATRSAKPEPIGFLTVGSDGRVLEASPSACSMLGVAEDKLFSIRLPADGDVALLVQHSALSSEGVRFEVEGDDELPRCVQLVGGATVLADGKIGRRIALTDMTSKCLDRRVAERTREVERTATELSRWLAARERQLAFTEQLIELAPAAVVVIDSGGRLLRYNQHFEGITGWPFADMRGRELWSLVPEAEQSEARAAFLRVFTETDRVLRTTRLCTRDGSTRLVEWRGVALRQEGEEPIALLAGTDVTERLELEAELRQAQKMEAVGTLASGVAHDFNNMLMGVIGCADRALSKLDASDAAVPLIEAIKNSAGASAAVVKQLLAFARKSDVELQPVDLGPLVRDKLAMLRHLSSDDIEVEIETAPGAWISADPGQVEQILLNLAVNAFQAMPQGGTLSLEVRGEDSDPPTVLLRVRDTGLGMDPTTRERAFEPFFTTKELGQGTGLGLSTVYAVVRRHGATIDIDSTPGRGCAVSVRFPRCAPPAAAAARARSEPPPARRATILVVEDEALIRLALRHYLERQGYSVLEAPDGAAAVHVARDHDGPIDLLLTDIVLPRSSGPRLAREIARSRPRLRVLYVSAHSREQLDREGRIGKDATLLQKPVSEACLVDQVRRALAMPPSLVAPVRPPAKVLVVDDDTATLSALAELLAEHGFCTLTAGSGAAALELIGQQRIDLIATDLELPNMDGATLVSRARELYPSLPALFTSGRTSEDPRVAPVLAMPRSAFLVKPVDGDAMASAARSLLARVEDRA